MHRLDWDSFQAVCIPRVPVLADRLSRCLRGLIDSPQAFDDAADLFELVILVARGEGKVHLYSSVALSRCLFFSMDREAFTLSDRLSTLHGLGLPWSVNEQVLPEFLTYRFVTPPATLLKGIFKLPPGQMLTLDLDRRAIATQRSTLPRHVPAVDPSRASRDLDSVLRAEMFLSSEEARHPRVLLSGGMDSTLLASILRARYETVASYSTGFECIDPANRELTYAQSAALAVGTRHQHVPLTAPAFLRAIVDATAANEEPIHHLQSAALLHLFATWAQDGPGAGAVFCGEAADGLFGNDTHDLLSRRLWAFKAMGVPGLRKLSRIARNMSLLPERLHYLDFDISLPAESPDHVFWAYGRYVSADKLTSVCTWTHEDITAGRRRLVELFPQTELLNQVTCLSFLTEGFATMSIWSRLASAQGLSMTYPFATPACLKLALGMPWAYKLRTRKTPINELLESYGVPPAIRVRTKQSFGLNSNAWAPRNALMQPLIDLVCSHHDPALIQRLQQGDRSDAMLLWNLVSLSLWTALVLERVSPEDIKAGLSEPSGGRPRAHEASH